MAALEQWVGIEQASVVVETNFEEDPLGQPEEAEEAVFQRIEGYWPFMDAVCVRQQIQITEDSLYMLTEDSPSK